MLAKGCVARFCGEGWRLKRASGSDETCVQGTRDGDVCCALDDGPAIPEKGDGVWAAPEAEEEIVGAQIVNIRMAGETQSHPGQIDRTAVLMNLHRVPAAKGDVRPAFSGEMGEHPACADGARGVSFGRGDLAVFETVALGRAPEIKGDEGSTKEVGLPRQEF